jgi:hypothetical protein
LPGADEVNLLYVDESGDTGKTGTDHLVLGAAALFEGKWRYLRVALAKLLKKYFPDEARRPPEIHCSHLRSGKGPFAALSISERFGFFAELCALLNDFRDSEITLFAVVYHKQAWFARNPGATGDALYSAAFADLVSRFDLFLKRRYREGFPSKGLIIADPRNSTLSRALRKCVLQFHDTGTPWATMENVIESVLFLESHESPGLQLADLCSYAVWRTIAAGDDALARKLKYCFDREPMTSTGAAGKWHGMKYVGSDPIVRERVTTVWT